MKIILFFLSHMYVNSKFFDSFSFYFSFFTFLIPNRYYPTLIGLSAKSHNAIFCSAKDFFEMISPIQKFNEMTLTFKINLII